MQRRMFWTRKGNYDCIKYTETEKIFTEKYLLESPGSYDFIN